jgi:hypothetical protein
MRINDEIKTVWISINLIPTPQNPEASQGWNSAKHFYISLISIILNIIKEI